MIKMYLTKSQRKDPSLKDLIFDYLSQGGDPEPQLDGADVVIYPVSVGSFYRIAPYIQGLLGSGVKITGDLSGLLLWIELPKTSWDNKVPAGWPHATTPDPTDDNPDKTRTKQWQEYCPMKKGTSLGLLLCEHSTTPGGMRFAPTFEELTRFVDNFLDGDYSKLITGGSYALWMSDNMEV